MFAKFSVFIYLLVTILFTLFINSSNDFAVKFRDGGVGFFNSILLDTKETITRILPSKTLLEDTKNLIISNEALKQDNFKLKQTILALEAKNQLTTEALKSLNIAELPKQHFISAKIVSYSLNGDNSFFKLAAGKMHKVQIGAPVINKDGLIGKIVKVHEHFATAQSVKSYNFKISGVSTISGTKCLIKGDGKEDSLKTSCLEANNFDVSGIENVVTAGNDGVFPYGIYLGKLRRLSEKEFVVEDTVMNKYDFAQILTESLHDAPQQ